MAQPAPTASPQRVQSVLDCRKLINDTDRLACYDQAVGALGQALSRDEIVAVDHSQLQEVRRQAFGFQLPSLGFLDRGAKPEEVDKVTLKVESARQGGDDKWVLMLEGGQVWRQIDDGQFSRDPKPGSMATISRAVLGSYIMTIGGHSPVRVHRDQ